MTYNVTSWFVSQAQAYQSEPIRKFTIGSSDYSAYVTRWPSFRTQWDQIRPGNLTISLANDEQQLNFFESDKVNMVNTCALSIGFTHPSSGDELLTMFEGTLDRVKIKKGICTLIFTDKFKQLSERLLGSQDAPVDYTTSNYLPSDLAWYMVTSYGGLSSVQSTSNPDIDYNSFLDWAKIFSGDNVRLNGRFTGAKVTEGLRKIARITRSGIFRYDNKIAFRRFSLVDSLQTTINHSNLLDSELVISERDIVNKQHVMFDYSVTSRYHQKTVIEQGSASVNSFGLKESIEKDSNLWYVDSVSALNLAQRVIQVKKLPYNSLQATTGMEGILRQIGEMIVFTDEQMGITSDSYRIMASRYNIDRGTVTFTIDASQVNNAFILDVSTLDGPDVLS